MVSFSIIIINFEYDKNSAKYKNITILVSMIPKKFAPKFVNTLWKKIKREKERSVNFQYIVYIKYFFLSSMREFQISNMTKILPNIKRSQFDDSKMH